MMIAILDETESNIDLTMEYMGTLVPEAGISGRDKLLHPTEYCGI